MNDNAVLGLKLASLRWAIVLSFFLVLLKGVGGVLSSSASLLASGLDSLMDMGLSSINYVSVKKGSKPPDWDHAYGHEKMESLAAYTEGLVIFVFAFFVLLESVRRTVGAGPAVHSGTALGVVLVAIIVNSVLTIILHRAGQKTDSLILKSEEAHYLMDILSYALIFMALILIRWTGWRGWDILGGVAVAVYVAFLAFRILVQAGHELVDRSLSPVAVDALDRLIRNHPGVLSYHELRTRKAGVHSFIDFHLVLAPKQSFEQAHEITESLIEKIQAKFRNADITVHEDPAGGR